MIINITILEDNKSDFITLSDSIKKWAANTGILINIIWLNSYKKFIKSLPTLKCDLFFSDIETIGCKAVVTPDNVFWSADKLFREIFREHLFMNR